MNLVKKIGKIVVPSARLRGFIMNPSRLIRIPYEKYLILTIGKKQQKALNRIKKKKKIKVAFFVIHASVWKYDQLYQLFEKEERFEPVIVICPYMNQGNDTMFKEMKLAINLFSKKKYNIVSTYNEVSKEWLDVKKEIDPDIVFFTNPHKLTKSQYYVTNFQDTLTIYVPYGIMAANIQEIQYNQLFHNLIWKCFYETEIHLEMAKKYARNKGRNVIITGYPGCDVFLEKKNILKDPWKIKDKNIKRIIWAPHHTIETNEQQLAYSNFLFDFQFMIELADKYKDQIQIAFKPHPMLKAKLFKLENWGKEKTEQYYKTWQNLTNGQLEEGDYIVLFKSSDAMILDSISFITEYLFTRKPSLFIIRDDTIKNKFNDFGKMVFELLYKSYRSNGIRDFIENVVIEENDYLEYGRLDFLQKYLYPPENKTATENILDNLLKELK